jgi:hypothetical protein
MNFQKSCNMQTNLILIITPRSKILVTLFDDGFDQTSLVFIIQEISKVKNFSIQRIYYIREDCDDDLQAVYYI